jgi:serine/threonine-protein kinase
MKIAPSTPQPAAPDEEATRMLPPRTAPAPQEAVAGTGARTSQSRQRQVWMLGGAAVVVLALGGIYLGSSGSSATAPPGPTPQGTAADSTAPRTEGARDTAASTSQAQPVQPARVKPRTTTAESTPPAKASSPAASPLLVPQPKPAVTPGEPRAASRPGTTAQDPEKACEGRVLFSYLNCVKEQCAKPAFAQHRVCVEHREMEQRNQQPSL